MVWLNNQHINESPPEGTFGGARCTCQKCNQASKSNDMKKPKTFKGEVFTLELHQLSKHDSSANFTISTCDDSVKNISTYYIDDLISLLKKAKQELVSNHEFETIRGEKYYSMKEKRRNENG